MLNKIGLITDPCGTPVVSKNLWEVTLPIRTRNERLVRKFFIHPKRFPVNPILESFTSKPCVDVVSYALLISKNSAYAFEFWENAVFIVWSKNTRLSFADRDCRKPDWLFDRNNYMVASEADVTNGPPQINWWFGRDRWYSVAKQSTAFSANQLIRADISATVKFVSVKRN